MNILLGCVGVVLVVLVVGDMLLTTLLLRGGGPLTARLNRLLWRAMLALHRQRPAHWLLSYAGLGVVLCTIVFWLGLLWLGWVCIFLVDPLAVLEAQNNVPASTLERVYFVGYTLITLGLGDYKAGGPVWQVATVIASANGFFVVTLIITYLLPVVSAVIHKRQLAIAITGLGATPTEIVGRAWNGQSFGELTTYFTSLTPDVRMLEQQHLAYPVLHYYHSQYANGAIAPRLAALDDTLTLLEYGVAPELRPDPTLLYPLRHAITTFLDTLETAFIKPDAETPPPPDLAALRTQGIAATSDMAFAVALNDLAARRRLLLALVRQDGWQWEDVHTLRS